MTTLTAERPVHDHEAFLADAALAVTRAQAVARFKDSTRAAAAVKSEWRNIRRTMIENAVHRLYKVLIHTEEVT